MKTYEIKDLLKKKLLIIELPEDTQFDVLVNNPLWKDGIKFLTGTDEKFHFIKGSYTLLGKPSEIKEEDIKDLVGKVKDYHVDDFELMLVGNSPMTIKMNKRIIVYKSYLNDNKGFPTALESFNSALESEIYWNVNPLGEEPILEAICCRNLRSDAWGYPQCCGVPNATEESIELHSMWHEAQEKTFDRNRTLIFVKD